MSRAKGAVLSESQPETEIVLPPSSTFPLGAITDPSCREQFLSTLQPLDHRSLGRVEVDQLMETMKLVMVAFGQKMANLETEMALRESRMENRLLQQDQELQQLRSELKIVKLEAEINTAKAHNNKLNKVIRLAKVLEGDSYRPYAVTHALGGYPGGEPQESKKKEDNLRKEEEKLPASYQERLIRAELNGFKWRNNLVPVKASKKMEKLIEWEDSFNLGKSLPLDKLLDQDYVFLLGKGAESAALLRLQELLKINLIKKFPNSTRHNLYQKAVRLAVQNGIKSEEVVVRNPFDEFVEIYWPHETAVMKDKISGLFAARGLSLKTFKICTTQKVQPSPDSFPYEKGDVDDYDRWISVRDGKYDQAIEGIIESYLKSVEQKD